MLKKCVGTPNEKVTPLIQVHLGDEHTLNLKDKVLNCNRSIIMDQPTQVYEAQVSGGIESGSGRIRKSHRLKKLNKKLQDYVLG